MAAAREVIGAEVAVLDAVLEHMPDRSEQHGGGDGEDSFLGTAASAQAQELGVQVGVLDTHCRPGRRHQCGLEPGGAFAGYDARWAWTTKQSGGRRW